MLSHFCNQSYTIYIYIYNNDTDWYSTYDCHLMKFPGMWFDIVAKYQSHINLTCSCLLEVHASTDEPDDKVEESKRRAMSLHLISQFKNRVLHHVSPSPISIYSLMSQEPQSTTCTRLVFHTDKFCKVRAFQ